MKKLSTKKLLEKTDIEIIEIMILRKAYGISNKSPLFERLRKIIRKLDNDQIIDISNCMRKNLSVDES